MLRVFEVGYLKQFGYGSYDEADGLVVANTESEALGLCLESNEDTEAHNWWVIEVDTSKPQCSAIVKSIN